MAKKQKENGISLHSAGEEFGKLLIKLYNVRIFPRTGKVFADKLFETGIEAGSLITGIHCLTEREAKIRTANKAVLALNEVIYICNLMEKAEYYKHAEVKDIEEYAGKILLGLQDLLNAVPIQQRRIRLAPSAIYGMTAGKHQRIPEAAKRVLAEYAQENARPVAKPAPAPKPAEVKPAEEKPAPKPAEAKPAEEKPAPKPAETKPTEAKPVKVKPAAVRTEPVKPVEKAVEEPIVEEEEIIPSAPAPEKAETKKEEKEEGTVIPPAPAEEASSPAFSFEDDLSDFVAPADNGDVKKTVGTPKANDDGFDDFV